MFLCIYSVIILQWIIQFTFTSRIAQRGPVDGLKVDPYVYVPPSKKRCRKSVGLIFPVSGTNNPYFLVQMTGLVCLLKEKFI